MLSTMDESCSGRTGAIQKANKLEITQKKLDTNPWSVHMRFGMVWEMVPTQITLNLFGSSYVLIS